VFVAGLDAALGELCLARLEPTGVLDTGFGSGGVAHTGVPGTDGVDLELGPAPMLAGVDADASRPFVARFDEDGGLDPTFGIAGTGLAHVDREVTPASPIALAVEPDGWIYLAGVHDSEPFVVRLTPRGVFDPGFGTGGFATTGETDEAESALDLVIQPDGNVLLAGLAQDPDGSSVDYVARFLASPFAGTSAPVRDVRGPPALGPCSPNPFRTETVARFSLPGGTFTRAAIYDVRGRLVTTLTEGYRPAGRHLLRWAGHDGHGRPVAAGVYFLRLECEGSRRTQKVVRLRG
jgi:uncharacterized delta-60 repeat protein